MAGLLAELAADGATVLFSSHQLDVVEELCEDVVVIDHGRIVLAGNLTDLRAEVPQRFVDLRYRGGSPDWSGLAGVQVIETAEDRVRLRVDPGTDLSQVLASAPRGGELVSLAFRPPTLSELFREAVAS
jgi:ABC-2 type transport system ATP-binding protein